MNIYIPVYKKLRYHNDLVKDRMLPVKGDLVVKPGEEVVPFTKVGRSKISKEKMVLDPKIKLTKEVKNGEFIYQGEKIGRVGIKSVVAPYAGSVAFEDDKPVFKQEMRDYWLLSGVWGTVQDAKQGASVSIKTQVVEVGLVSCTADSMMGELIVFPNPSKLLDLEYLEHFTNNSKNKIIYVGHYIRKEVVKRAVELGITAVIGGSIEKEMFNYARSQGLIVAVITGFGDLQTPPYIFEFLKNISNRHVFIDGYRNVLQVPTPKENDFSVPSDELSIRKVEKGLPVIVYTKDNFGSSGIVEQVQGRDIYVKLSKSQESVVVKTPSIFALR